MHEESRVTPCCRKYSRPDRECDQYPDCKLCDELIADGDSPQEELHEHTDAAAGHDGPIFAREPDVHRHYFLD